LEYARSVPVVCLSCGYIEFYATLETLEKLKEEGSYAAYKKAWAERKAERERLEQEKKSQKRRFFW